MEQSRWMEARDEMMIMFLKYIKNCSALFKNQFELS